MGSSPELIETSYQSVHGSLVLLLGLGKLLLEDILIRLGRASRGSGLLLRRGSGSSSSGFGHCEEQERSNVLQEFTR